MCVCGTVGGTRKGGGVGGEHGHKGGYQEEESN